MIESLNGLLLRISVLIGQFQPIEPPAADNSNFAENLVTILTWIFIVIMALIVPYSIYLGFLLAKATDENKRREAQKRIINSVASVIIIMILVSILQMGSLMGAFTPGGGSGHNDNPPRDEFQLAPHFMWTSTTVNEMHVMWAGVPIEVAMYTMAMPNVPAPHEFNPTTRRFVAGYSEANIPVDITLLHVVGERPIGTTIRLNLGIREPSILIELCLERSRARVGEPLYLVIIDSSTREPIPQPHSIVEVRAVDGMGAGSVIAGAGPFTPTTAGMIDVMVSFGGRLQNMNFGMNVVAGDAPEGPAEEDEFALQVDSGGLGNWTNRALLNDLVAMELRLTADNRVYGGRWSIVETAGPSGCRPIRGDESRPLGGLYTFRSPHLGIFTFEVLFPDRGNSRLHFQIEVIDR